MTEPRHRFVHVSRTSQIFVLVSAIALIAILLLTARAQRWFEGTVPFRVRLPEIGSLGLAVGSPVELLGITVGVVDDLSIDEDETMWARIEVRQGFARFVRIDSRCTIKKKTFDLVGDAFLEISRGTGTVAEKGAMLEADAARGVTEEFGTVLQDLGREMTPTIKEVRAAVQLYSDLARQLQDPDGRVQQAFTRLESITRAIDSGNGVVGRLLRDDALADEVDHIVQRIRELVTRLDDTFEKVDADLVASAQKARMLVGELAEGERSLPALVGELRALLEQLQPIVNDLRAAIAPLPGVTAAAAREADALPGMVASARATMFEAERLILALQNHWLLRPYVAPTQPTGRLGGEGIGGGR